MFETYELSQEERLKTGCSHVVHIDYAKLDDTADTTVTLTLLDYIARDVIDKVIVDNVTPFDGGATSALKLDVGYNGASVDDADAFIDNIELHADGTELLASVNTPPAVGSETVNETFGTEESTVISELVTTVSQLRAERFAAQEAGSLEAVFTATGANLSALTTGRVHIYINRIRLSGIRPISL